MYLHIDVALTETAIADDFAAALAARELPEKFFYWFPRSVQAWLALCGEGEYRNFSRSYQLVEHHASDLARHARRKHAEVVSLGAGQGDKDRLVLAALAAARKSIAYRPVDASQALLEIAVRDALAAGFETRGLKADLMDAAHVAPLRGALGEHHRVFLLLGNTLGGFDPFAVARRVAGLMVDGDVAVIDGELFAGEETLAGYDNPLNRRFAFAPLAAAGISPDDGTLEFGIERDAERDGLYRVTKHFTAARDVRMLVAGETVALAPGERIAMSASHKYDEDTFLTILREAALVPIATYRSRDGNFLMTVVGRG